MRGAQISSGKLIARLLSLSWRSDFPDPELSESQLATITPLLLDSGGGALAWWRIRSSRLACTSSGLDLQQAFRQHVLLSGYFELMIEAVIKAMQRVDLDPILVKGWSIARAYPLAGLRPYGDIDLCVPPYEYERASRLIESLEDVPLAIDLHSGFAPLLDRSQDEIYERAQLVQLGSTPIKVLSDEDSFHLLCVHLLRHGVARPLWLCDVAVALESRAHDFNWDWCLGANRRRANWIACAIRLVNELLDADDRNLPKAVTDTKLPDWVISEVVKQWGVPFAKHPSRQPSFRTYLRRPSWWWKVLKDRWPNQIQGVVSLNLPFTKLPRFPFQVGACVLRAARTLFPIAAGHGRLARQ